MAPWMRGIPGVIFKYGTCTWEVEKGFCNGIGSKEFAQNPSLKTLPKISIPEKVEQFNFNG